MTKSTPIVQSDPPLPARLEALEKLLAGQLEEYRALLALIEQKGEAIRHARLERIAELFERERAIVERISNADRQRSELIRSLSKSIAPDEKKTLRVTEIAQAHPNEECRTRLLAITEQLRALATEVSGRSNKVRAAAEALARHMSGVMQTVRSALSRAGVYENKGRLAVGAQLEFSVDLRS